MRTLKEVIDFQRSLGKCCGSCEEDFVIAGFKAATEVARDTEKRLEFTNEVTNELERELNRYKAEEKLLRERAMTMLGL